MSWKNFVVGLIIFVIGIFLVTGFYTVCLAKGEVNCSQPGLFYAGFILALISGIYLWISLTFFIVNKSWLKGGLIGGVLYPIILGLVQMLYGEETMFFIFSIPRLILIGFVIGAIIGALVGIFYKKPGRKRR